MRYIGNQPSIDIVQSLSDRFDYIVAADPTATSNPSAPFVVETTGVSSAIASRIFRRVPPPLKSGATLTEQEATRDFTSCT